MRTLLAFLLFAAVAAFAPAAQLVLTWSDNSDNESGFKIERKVADDEAAQFAEVASVAPNVVQYTDTGLAPDMRFTYRVRAWNSGGHSPYSNEASATTREPPPAGPGDSLSVPDEPPILDADGNLTVRGNLSVGGDLEVAGVIKQGAK